MDLGELEYTLTEWEASVFFQDVIRNSRSDHVNASKN